MRIDKFPGVVTDQDPYEVGVEGLVTGENIDLSKNHNVSRRQGFTSFYPGTIQAAWGDDRSFLLVEGNELRSLDDGANVSTLATGLADCTVLRGLRAYDDRIFWTTLADSGVVEGGTNREWGVLKPTATVAVSTAGQMPEGRYKVGLCYVNSRGIEGPIHYVLAELSGGVSVEIPHSVLDLAAESIEYVRLYISTTDGQVLYFANELAVGDSGTIEYTGDTSDLQVAAEANNYDNMPTDGFLEEHGGRIWTSTRGASGGGIVVYSNPYSELTDLLANFFPFKGEITGLGSVESGLYVGTTEGVYYLNGHDPEQMVALEKVSYGVIPGTMVKADGRLVGEGANATVLLWSSDRGFCAGFPGGEVVNLTERRVGTLTGAAGTAILRRANGQNHLLTVLRQ